ncbi:hypothetical protein ACOAPY_12450 [Pseudomonas sp. P3C3]
MHLTHLQQRKAANQQNEQRENGEAKGRARGDTQISQQHGDFLSDGLARYASE